MSQLSNLEIITEIFSNFGKLEIYQNNSSNKISFKKENINHIIRTDIIGCKLQITGKLKSKDLNLKLGRGYFLFDNKPYCCNIISISFNHPNKYEIIIDIIIYANKQNILKLTDLELMFLKYEGKIFKKDGPIENRADILDLRL